MARPLNANRGAARIIDQALRRSVERAVSLQNPPADPLFQQENNNSHLTHPYPSSDVANVGTDKDSDKRQRAAIEAFAESAGFIIVAEYYDKAVSGADRIDQRPGFAEMLQRLAANGIIVESLYSKPASPRIVV